MRYFFRGGIWFEPVRLLEKIMGYAYREKNLVFRTIAIKKFSRKHCKIGTASHNEWIL